jgi:hypothetical protein
LRVEAAIARSGVLPYSDGTRERKEYRPPAEAFKADSMATAKGGPVTDLHPPKLVTPETFKAVSRGHACDDVRRDGDLLVVDLMVQDADLCALVESGERREVSCGYSCVVVPTPGVTPEGERYDAVQTQIVHNHVALLAPGTGRSGPEVSLRMDGAAVEVRLDGAGVQSRKTIESKGGRVIKLDAAVDGADVQGVVDEVRKKADEGADAAATCDAVSKKLTETLAEVATLEGQLTARPTSPRSRSPPRSRMPSSRSASRSSPTPGRCSAPRSSSTGSPPTPFGAWWCRRRSRPRSPTSSGCASTRPTGTRSRPSTARAFSRDASASPSGW